MRDADLLEDPGWRPAVTRALPFAILPPLIRTGLKDPKEGEPSIVALRAVFMGIVGALAIYFVVLSLLYPLMSDGPVPVAAYLLLAAGVIPLGMIRWARRRLLGFCGPPDALAQVYSTTLFMGVAFAGAAGMFGFVASFQVGASWPHLVGIAMASVGFAMVAPTSTRIRDLDERLSSRGCQHSLREGLFTS